MADIPFYTRHVQKIGTGTSFMTSGGRKLRPGAEVENGWCKRHMEGIDRSIWEDSRIWRMRNVRRCRRSNGKSAPTPRQPRWGFAGPGRTRGHMTGLSLRCWKSWTFSRSLNMDAWKRDLFIALLGHYLDQPNGEAPEGTA